MHKILEGHIVIDLGDDATYEIPLITCKNKCEINRWFIHLTFTKPRWSCAMIDEFTFMACDRAGVSRSELKDISRLSRDERLIIGSIFTDQEIHCSVKGNSA